MMINDIAQGLQMNQLSLMDQELMKLGIHQVPYKSRLSLAPLINHIRVLEESDDFGQRFLANEILQRLEKAPELLNPIDDLSLVEKHKDLLHLFMLCFFPPMQREEQLIKISKPFDLIPIYISPAAKKLMDCDGILPSINIPADIIYSTTVIRAAGLILNKFYGQRLDIEPLMNFNLLHPETKLRQYFKLKINLNYTDVVPTKPIRPISQDQINQLLANIYDVDIWLKYIPADHFELHGLVVSHLIDITEEEALSQLKFKLLEKNAIVDAPKVKNLELMLRSFFRMHELRMGLTAIDYPLEQAVNHKYKIRFDFLAGRHPNLLLETNRHSIYEKVCKYRETLLVEDLESIRNKTPIEKDLLKEGFRSIIVAPLFNKNERVIGLLEIGSPKAYQLNSFVEQKMKAVVGLFSMALERSREEIDNTVESIIREQYTAVHPSVEWKFIETSYNLLEARETDEHAIPEPIVFEDVFPLYGQADIVGSSTKRNQAIQADLIDNLHRVSKVMAKCVSLFSYPLLNYLMVKVNRCLQNLGEEFNSNDETQVVDLLIQEIHPLLKDINKRYPGRADFITPYFEGLDPELGIVYQQRKAFEESVTILNNTIGNYLDQQQRSWQAVMPHYFEKYKTDGVEYDMYVGKSLLKDGNFCQMHLRNFRLWQLIDMCEITRRVEKLKSELPVPLSTAQLIFAYNTPLSIRFRMDEKQFDVDGAYNVRYEILKKRIDKALIEGTEERLTQSRKIAVVYLQEKDRQEYLEYLDYLRQESYITGEIEDLELARLQGVQGLRALRMTVK